MSTPLPTPSALPTLAPHFAWLSYHTPPSHRQARDTLPPAPQAADLALVRDAHAALLETRSSAAGITVVLLAGTLITATLWAYFAQVEEITRGNARIISSTGEQKVNSLEGGILSKLMVREGDTVQAGQVLAKLDPTKANASFQESDVRRTALLASAVRLRAEANGSALVFPAALLRHKDTVDSEQRAFKAKRDAVEQSVAALQLNIKNVERELAMLRPLVKEGAVSMVETMRLERQVGELQAQVLDRVNKARAESNIELIKIESELSQLGENIKARVDTVERTWIRSPMRASVKSIKHNTLGSVIPATDTIMELVPLDDGLVVEARIRPSEVAFLRSKLPVTLKISAYDYTVYGTLQGEIKFISPDTLKDDKRLPGEDETYYRVLITANTNHLKANGKTLDITPGMTATAEILTGKRSVLDYLLKPVFKAKEAFRER